MDVKKDKFLRRKDAKIRRKKQDVKNPLISENELYEENTLHVAARLTKRTLS